MGGQKAVHVDHAAADDRRARRRLAVQNRAQYPVGKGHEARHVLTRLMPRQRYIAGIEQLAGLKFARSERRLHDRPHLLRSEEHTSELQSLMRISYAVFCLKKKQTRRTPTKY